MDRCVSGRAKTPYYFGNDESLIKHFACFRNNSNNLLAACSTFMPNRLGLFDTYGNAAEACHLLNGSALTALGGGYLTRPDGCQARMDKATAWKTGPFSGFRVVCRADQISALENATEG